jgi:hypothetical protein
MSEFGIRFVERRWIDDRCRLYLIDPRGCRQGRAARRCGQSSDQNGQK